MILCYASALVRISYYGIIFYQNDAAFGKLSILVHMQGIPLACESAHSK